jgi:hypothetical protein
MASSLSTVTWIDGEGGKVPSVSREFEIFSRMSPVAIRNPAWLFRPASCASCNAG